MSDRGVSEGSGACVGIEVFVGAEVGSMDAGVEVLVGADVGGIDVGAVVQAESTRLDTSIAEKIQEPRLIILSLRFLAPQYQRQIGAGRKEAVGQPAHWSGSV